MKLVIRYKEQDTVIIAFLVNNAKVSKLRDSFGGDADTPTHMTLLYIGDTKDLDEHVLAGQLDSFAKTHAPVDGVYNGYAVFEESDNGRHPVVILYDSPQLPIMRQRLREAFPDVIEQDHGFTPHTTLAYIDKPNKVEMVKIKHTFDEVSLLFGDRVYTSKLTGTVVEKQRISNTRCMNCPKPPQIDVHWADGRGRAWFCEECYSKWISESDREIVRAWYVTDGEVPNKLNDHKRSERVDVNEIFKGGPGSGHYGHAGRPGKRGGSLPSASFGMPIGLHTSEGQKKVIVYLERETGMKFKPWGSLREGGKVSENDIDIAVVEPSQEEEERLYWEAMEEEGRLYQEVLAGRMTETEFWQEIHSDLDEFDGITEALSKLGYEYTGTAAWQGIQASRYENKDTGHAIEVWGASDVGYYGQYVAAKGGPGSGHFGHRGRPGKVGGSVPEGKYRVPSVADRKWVQSLTNNEKKAIWRYLNAGSAEINGAIRSGNITPELKKVIIALDSAISKAPKSDGHVVLYRGMPYDISEVGEGGGYVSAAFSKGVAGVYTGISRRVIKFIVKAGIPIAPISILPFKDIAEEVLLPRGLSADDLVELDIDVVEKQLPIDDVSRKRLIDIRIQLFDDLADGLAEKVYSGDISIGSWEERMKKAIRELHSSTAAIGKGGWDNMTFEDWGRLGPAMKDQYRWLHGFAETIDGERDTISLRAIQARAKLYGRAGGHSAARMEAGRVIESMLPWLPKDGSTECLTQCRCNWSLEIVNKEGNFNVVQATWELNPAEHCPDCVGRDGHVEVIRVFEGIPVPTTIAGY